MTNILLVDDDLRAIESISMNIDWQSLGVDSCFCAASTQQAKDLIRKESISIVIADIEMPEESGLELVEWINNNTRNIVCIFLTSYGDFAYTSRAMRLGPSDYLLKPAPYTQVEAAVRRAVSQLAHLQQRELSSQLAGYWNDSLPALQEQFWQDVICGRIQQNEMHIARQAQRRHIPYVSQENRLVLFELPDIPSIRWEQDLVDVAMKNILGEVFEHTAQTPIVIHFSGSSYFTLISNDFAGQALLNRCQETVNVLESLFSGTVLCVIGGAVLPSQLHGLSVRLLDAREEDFDGEFVCVHGDRGSSFKSEMTQWIVALAEGKYPQVLSDIRTYFASTKLQPYQLAQLYRTLSWKLYQIVNQKQLNSIPFLVEKGAQLSQQASRSTEGLLRWLEWMLRLLTAEDPEIKSSAVAQIQNYIREHLAEDLNRENLAAVTFLSVDYISHLFTQTTGQCLSEYIITQRIERAKELLKSTNMNVTSIAIGVGYNNVSYFNRLFKRETGMTPQRYRKHGDSL